MSSLFFARDYHEILLVITDNLIVTRLQNCHAVRIECEILFAKLLIEYHVRGERELSRDLD